jgi:hypothetical protein
MYEKKRINDLLGLRIALMFILITALTIGIIKKIKESDKEAFLSKKVVEKVYLKKPFQ